MSLRYRAFFVLAGMSSPIRNRSLRRISGGLKIRRRGFKHLSTHFAHPVRATRPVRLLVRLPAPSQLDSGKLERLGSNPTRVNHSHTARSSNGSGHRSDKAEKKVRLLFGLLCGEHTLCERHQLKRIPRPNTESWCNCCTVSFQLAGRGFETSSPRDRDEIQACSSTVRAGSL